MKMPTLAKIILKNDSLLCGGRHIEAISHEFVKRNILDTTYLSIENNSRENFLKIDYKINYDVLTTHKYLTISFDETLHGRFILTDASGKVITNQAFTNSVINYDMLNQSAGMYFIQFVTDKGSMSRKLVVR
jgi:hypothetical protein